MALDPNRWTIKTQEAFQVAMDLARQQHHPEITPEHVLAALLSQEEGVVLPVLEKLGLAPLVVRNRVDDTLAKLPKTYGGAEPQLARATRDALEAADRERAELRDDYLSTEHLLLALADKVGLTREQVLKQIRSAVSNLNPEEVRAAADRPLRIALRGGQLLFSGAGQERRQR